MIVEAAGFGVVGIAAAGHTRVETDLPSGARRVQPEVPQASARSALKTVLDASAQTRLILFFQSLVWFHYLRARSKMDLDQTDEVAIRTM